MPNITKISILLVSFMSFVMWMIFTSTSKLVSLLPVSFKFNFAKHFKYIISLNARAHTHTHTRTYSRPFDGHVEELALGSSLFPHSAYSLKQYVLLLFVFVFPQDYGFFEDKNCILFSFKFPGLVLEPKQSCNLINI